MKRARYTVGPCPVGEGGVEGGRVGGSALGPDWSIVAFYGIVLRTLN